MSTKNIILLSRIDFLPTDTYSCTKLKLIALHKLIRKSTDQDITNGAFNKILEVFLTKNKYVKDVCIDIFKDIHYKILSLDNLKIIRMFYQNDPDVTKLTLKFVKIFFRFFVNDDIVIYYVLKSKCKSKYKVIDRLYYESEEMVDEFLKSVKIYKYKNIIRYFCTKTSRNQETDFLFEINDCEIGADFICKINGYKDTKLFKKIKKSVKNKANFKN
ncbi:hypothetical protein P3W45_000048 [Vairimorpha bombi]